MSGYEGPRCVNCGIKACAEKDATPPVSCPMANEPEVLAGARKAMIANPGLRRLAQESARTEAAGYGKATRVEEIMDFARRMGWSRLGIAHCIGLMREARMAQEIFVSNGFQCFTACCKMGAIPKEEVGLAEADKICPGEFEVLCNPIGQAAILADAETEFNVVIGLCVGHDSLFFMHSKAPVSVLVAKDRVLGHNPVAALNTWHSYYRKLDGGKGQILGR